MPSDRRRLPRWAARTLLVALGSLASLCVLELLAVVWTVATQGEYVSAASLYGRGEDAFVAELHGAEACRYVDSLFPHPYLGFVHHANQPCGIPYLNRSGLFGEDFPVRHRTDRFVVMLTGGSVAAQLGQLRPEGIRFLERELNARFVSPSGAPFLVLNGADGAWKQPQQTIQYLLNADFLDAVVTLDGYNEHHAIRSSRLEHPLTNFEEVNPLARQSFGRIVARWWVGRLFGAAATTPILADSHAAYLVTSRLRLLVAGSEDTGRRKTTVSSLFAFPDGWTEEARFRWNVDKYRSYMADVAALAKRRGALAAHFIQPVPALAKPLSKEERAVVGELSYGPSYAQMARALVAEADGSEVDAYSLVEIFAEHPEALYADSIHLRFDSEGDSPGYRLMAASIADRLAESWQLTPR